MLDFINKFFRKDESSRSLAKERLRLVLMSDRVSLAPETFAAMKGEMLGVLQRYLEIDEHGLDVHFENAERRFMLLANIPVNHVKSNEQIEQERRQFAVNAGNGSAEAPPPVRRRRRRKRAAANAAAPAGEANSTAGETNVTTNQTDADEDAAADDRLHGSGTAGNGAMNGYRPLAESEPESPPDLPNAGEDEKP